MESDFKILNEIQARPGASDGLWILFLLPLSIILSALKNPFVLTTTYKLTSLMCIGLIFTSFVILLQNRQIKKIKTFSIEMLITAITMFLLFYSYNKNWSVSIISAIFCTIVYQRIYIFVLKKFKECFTLGEAAVAAQATVIILYSTIINLKNNKFETSIQISTIIIQLGLIGIATIAGISTILQLQNAKSFYITTFLIILLVIFAPLHIVMKRSPVVWIFQQLFKDILTVKLLIYWSVCVGITILVLSNQILHARKASTGMRKTFHILTVLVFVPGLLYECSLLYLATGVTLGIFFALEILRIFEIPPLNSYLQDGFTVFSDEKDTGMIALTPIYLLIGSSLPIWIHPSPCDVTGSAMFNILPLLSGLLSIGLGDTMASIIGSNYGKFKWPGSRKTVEGTLACILSQIGFFHFLMYFDIVQNISNELQIRTYSAIFVTSIIEASTNQVDNLVLPIIMYIILI